MRRSETVQKLTLTFAALALFAIAGQAQKPKATTGVNVNYRGAMRDIFDKNDLTGKVELKMFRTMPHFYALGPVEGLKGEIMVWDSVPYISQIREDALHIETSFDYRAVFCVWARVSAW